MSSSEMKQGAFEIESKMDWLRRLASTAAKRSSWYFFACSEKCIVVCIARYAKDFKGGHLT